jgi:urease accessory protein
MAMRWELLQIADSAFPTGGFAHSAGFEALAHAGEVQGAADLERWVNGLAWQVGQGSLPWVSAAHGAPERLAELDARADAVILNHVANRASRTQGRAWLETASRVFEGDVRAMRERARQGAIRCHLAPVFGAIARAIGATADEARQVFLLLSVRGAVSAAVRLSLVGPLEGQRILRRQADDWSRVLERCRDLGEDDVAQTSPVLELVQGMQDRLYARLFQS